MTKHLTGIMNRIMERIISGEYSDKLPPQDALALALGIGRSTLREAISKLEGFNIVLCQPRSGTKIMPPSEWHRFNPEVIAWHARLKDPAAPALSTKSFDCSVVAAWKDFPSPRSRQP
ncbi:FadR/GntR family transcriptional regulator [Paraburkholderia sp. BR14320]|uniref:FadR/GntR family transcriptional regulator n=1 Tax=unclassified Paraburkholderia TaxID=2615204 RepID=UPI0034CD201C